jgi:hypothetical protein
MTLTNRIKKAIMTLRDEGAIKDPDHTYVVSPRKPVGFRPVAPYQTTVLQDGGLHFEEVRETRIERMLWAIGKSGYMPDVDTTPTPAGRLLQKLLILVRQWQVPASQWNEYPESKAIPLVQCLESIERGER